MKWVLVGVVRFLQKPRHPGFVFSFFFFSICCLLRFYPLLILSEWILQSRIGWLETWAKPLWHFINDARFLCIEMGCPELGMTKCLLDVVGPQFWLATFGMMILINSGWFNQRTPKIASYITMCWCKFETRAPGRFEIQKALGAGCFGQVWRGPKWDPSNGKSTLGSCFLGLQQDQTCDLSTSKAWDSPQMGFAFW